MEGARCRSKTKPTKTPDRMEPSDAVYKCEPSRKATRGHHATVLEKGVAQQDTESYKPTGERLSFLLPGRRGMLLTATARDCQL